MSVCTACAQQNPEGFKFCGACGALLAGDFVRAAEIYAEAGTPPGEAYTRLRAAEAGLPGAQLEKAIAFYRRARATAYLARAESLVEVTA